MNGLLMVLTAAAACALVALETQAGDAPKAIPVYKTYKLRNDKEVTMSGSQWAIANGQWHVVSPETIAEIAARITVTIRVDKNDGTHMLGTGFFINRDEVVTNWHVVRDAANITVVNGEGARANAQLALWKPSADLATIIVPSVYSNFYAAFDTDSDWERIGEKVYVYGNPQGMEGTFCDGMFSAWRANGAVFQISAPIDHGSSGSPVFNQYGLVIGIVSECIVSTAQINLALSSNAIYEALGLKTDDHPHGFDLGLTPDLELRDSSEIDADIAMANAARIEAENQERAANGPSADELRNAAHSAEIRASNERALKALSASSDARLAKAEGDLQEAWDALPGSTQAELQELKNTYDIEQATGELKLQKILDLTAELLLRAGAPDAS